MAGFQTSTHGRFWVSTEVIRNVRWPATRSVEDTTGLLERLSRLREQGAVDQDEFERLKREIFAAAT